MGTKHRCGHEAEAVPAYLTGEARANFVRNSYCLSCTAAKLAEAGEHVGDLNPAHETALRLAGGSRN